MKRLTLAHIRLLLSALLSAVILTGACSINEPSEPIEWAWETVSSSTSPAARHEASLVAYKGRLYLLGGRGIKPVNVYDPETGLWESKSETPIELHHFQAVVHGDAIYLIGAMTGPWPNETAVDRVIAYYPDEDRFEYLHSIPENRRRGGAGAAVMGDKIYLAGGITNGHMDGAKPWLDEYDIETGAWRVLPDAPHARDHFQLVSSNNKLYAFGGRRSRYRTGEGFELTVPFGDVFNLKTERWDVVRSTSELPTQRAGNMAFAWDGEVVIGGGESATQVAAHDHVEAFHVQSQSWRAWPSLNRGRHGSGFAVIDDYVYTASGSGNRGGEPELTSLERLKLPRGKSPVTAVQPIPVHQLWHTVTLSFEGPMTSEKAISNPFTDYRLLVDFVHAETTYTVRGFYAADGHAAETGADSGNVWQVRFAPDLPGEWTYSARLENGDQVGIDSNAPGETIALDDASGTFLAVASEKGERDFRAYGRLNIDQGYFRLGSGSNYWLKGGTNSPENLLGYVDFDGTYRIEEEARDGEAAAGTNLHEFAPHLSDWMPGDPVWQGDKGKGLIGAINYLASERMNAAYFLTFNIGGDGNDVWPFASPDDFSRFDVSKLDQWEIVFSHMQAKGILLHVVLQETENELTFDGGDTGPDRQLYLNEMISRFAHHPALVWNIGEENGPVFWRPEGQTTQQRMDMATYLKRNDPYQNLVFLHTHAEPEGKLEILEPLLGFPDLDGLSFQVANRETVNAEVRNWRSKSTNANRPWAITMDEIGEWHTGALMDSRDPGHDSLRRHALWGTLLGGGSGVEWYFGARSPATDLTSEDWRLRSELWRQTRHALAFFEAHLPYWEMTPCNQTELYCLEKPGEVFALYVPTGTALPVVVPPLEGVNSVRWFDPKVGGDLLEHQVGFVFENGETKITETPDEARDWVLLIRYN